ncbi:MAG: TerB family tellurite resistance protein [Chitinophagales bacterium]|nr:TerB family tellurite resistance protein [Chitinophagales bacterium]
MEDKLNYIRCLVHMAYANGALHESEKAYVLSVARKLGLEEETAKKELSSSVPYQLPEDPVLRYQLLHDLLQTMAADKDIDQNELSYLTNVTKQLGYEEELMHCLVEQSKSNIWERGFVPDFHQHFPFNKINKNKK